MSVSIKVKTANFTNFFSSLTLPNRAGLIAEHIFGTSEAESIRNRANLALPAAIIPSTAATPLRPTFTPYSMTAANHETTALSHGMRTQISPPADCTVIVIRKATAGQAAKVFASGATVTGCTGFFESATEFSFCNGYFNGSTDQAEIAVPASPSDFYFSAGVGRVNTPGKIYHYFEGVLSSDVGTTVTAARVAGELMEVGCVVGSTQQRGTAEIAYAAMYNRLLSEAEVMAAYAQLKAYYAEKIVIS